MINFDVLASRVMRSKSCDRPTALSALADAYLTCDRTVSEAQQASYLYTTACFNVVRLDSLELNCNRERLAYQTIAQNVKRMSEKSGDGDNVDTTVEDVFCHQPEEVQDDKSYLLDMTRGLPREYRIATIAVANDLLSSNTTKRKPLTVEMTRQILKRHRIGNTSKMARHVYTFLTTIKR